MAVGVSIVHQSALNVNVMIPLASSLLLQLRCGCLKLDFETDIVLVIVVGADRDDGSVDNISTNSGVMMFIGGHMNQAHSFCIM